MPLFLFSPLAAWVDVLLKIVSQLSVCSTAALIAFRLPLAPLSGGSLYQVLGTTHARYRACKRDYVVIHSYFHSF